jgi:uncharacterized protein (TIGR02284 family)
MASTNESIDQLNSFLRGEISAVETYRQAIDALKSSSNASMLQQWKQSHESRVAMLRDRITQLGGKPADGSGPWGAFAKLIEGGASVLGEKTAIAALEEGEDHGLKDYQTDVGKLDADSRSFLVQQIMPEQKKTHDGLRDLKKSMS